MAGGGKIKIKGGIPSFNEAQVIDGALLVTVGAGGGAGVGRFQHRFDGADSGAGVTSVDLMNGNAIGVPLARAVDAANVAVKFKRTNTGALGDWTLKLFKNGVLVATFSVTTT